MFQISNLMSSLLLVLSILFSSTHAEYIATGYAPLDKNARVGMCYSGDPKVTASGQPTKPGITVAAPKHIPFGTWLYIEGIGFRKVEDRGGRIKKNKIDICFQTRKEAMEWGRRKVKVYIINTTIFTEGGT